MSELVKDFIKFIAEVILFLTLFYVIFSPSGIVSNSYFYLTIIEPIILQDYISSAIIVGGNSPGEFFTQVETSGQPHTIEISREGGVMYVFVKPAQEPYLEGKLVSIGPTPVITDCELLPQTIQLEKKATEIIMISKTIEDGSCKISVLA